MKKFVNFFNSIKLNISLWKYASWLHAPVFFCINDNDNDGWCEGIDWEKKEGRSKEEVGRWLKKMIKEDD